MRETTLRGVLRGRVAETAEKSLQLVQVDFVGGVSSELALLSEWRNSLFGWVDLLAFFKW